jgi:K+-transporting ATPase A subunit
MALCFAMSALFADRSNSVVVVMVVMVVVVVVVVMVVVVMMVVVGTTAVAVRRVRLVMAGGRETRCQWRMSWHAAQPETR